MKKGSEKVHLSTQRPRMLGRYRILEEVGSGATALVYKAYDPQLDRFLAIKVLRDRLAKDEDYRNGFIREARLAAQLTHPNIVTIFDVGITDEKPYIAMELLEGATLEDILKNKNKLAVKTVMAISCQLAAALSYAHQQGVVHRDIKPGNILILRDKKTTKLTDFGIAQIDETLSKTGRLKDKVLGTPEYMSPEQLLGQSVDGRSDIYSTGVLIYRMLVGRPPFMADDLGKLFKQIIKNKQPELVVDNDKIKDDLKDLVRKLLQKQPAKRFQNASILLAELNYVSNKLHKIEIKKTRFFSSLTARWTMIMAGTVFVTMCIGLVIVYWMQFNALSGMTLDYGQTVSRMIAYQSSEAVILKDSIGLNVLINENIKNEQLESIVILDLSKRILASSSAQKPGREYVIPEGSEIIRSEDKSNIYQRKLADERILFDVNMAIYYADKEVGSLVVSFAVDSMFRASKATLVTMLLVMLVTLFTVSIATLILAKQTSNDYRRVTQGLRKILLGRVDARILSRRNDEASQLFSVFNQLAAHIETILDKKTSTSKEPNGHRSGSQKMSDINEFPEVTAKIVNQVESSDIDTVEILISTKKSGNQ